MNVANAFPSRYLKAADLGDVKVRVKISHVTEEVVGRDSKETKPVVYFHGKDKGLALNKTNGKKIAEIQGGSWDSDDWADLEIILYATETEFGGETVDCIRVMDPAKLKAKPAAKKPLPPPEPVETDESLGVYEPTDDEVPF